MSSSSRIKRSPWAWIRTLRCLRLQLLASDQIQGLPAPPSPRRPSPDAVINEFFEGLGEQRLPGPSCLFKGRSGVHAATSR